MTGLPHSCKSERKYRISDILKNPTFETNDQIGRRHCENLQHFQGLVHYSVVPKSSMAGGQFGVRFSMKADTPSWATASIMLQAIA